ncbi:Uncharacterised protein [Cardiobacterium valvarum]|uniref:Uncharacterized protein n=1 Tax=Cardiobacterium valvarum TaxID=194702 RepID=A0A381DXV1_9GAMM|nr:Uncharacterised protein [Cardiobacterium valvarum]
MTRSNTFTRFNQHFTIRHNIKSNSLTFKLRWLEFYFQFASGNLETLRFKKFTQNISIAISERVQQYCNWQFTATVNTTIEQILSIKLKIQPGTTIRNNPCGKEQFSRTMPYTFVVVKKDPRRSM